MSDTYCGEAKGEKDATAIDYKNETDRVESFNKTDSATQTRLRWPAHNAENGKNDDQEWDIVENPDSTDEVDTRGRRHTSRVHFDMTVGFRQRKYTLFSLDMSYTCRGHADAASMRVEEPAGNQSTEQLLEKGPIEGSEEHN